MMAGRAAARAVAMRRHHAHKNRLLYKDAPRTERVSTSLGQLMVVYTLLLVIYVILDVVSIQDARDFDKAYRGHQGNSDYDPEIHDRVQFMINLRMFMLVPTILTMLLTWVN